MSNSIIRIRHRYGSAVETLRRQARKPLGRKLASELRSTPAQGAFRDAFERVSCFRGKKYLGRGKSLFSRPIKSKNSETPIQKIPLASKQTLSQGEGRTDVGKKKNHRRGEYKGVFNLPTDSPRQSSGIKDSYSAISGVYDP